MRTWKGRQHTGSRLMTLLISILISHSYCGGKEGKTRKMRERRKKGERIRDTQRERDRK